MDMLSRPTKTFLATASALGLALSAAACTADNGSRAATTAATTAATARWPATAEQADATPGRLATANFDVDGMTCGGCVLATELSVKKLTGVRSVNAEYDEETDQGRCTVDYDPSAVDTDQIAAAIERAGFTPTLTSPEGG